MKVTCLTVSVDYSDYLEHVLEANHLLFHKWIIVTSHKDLATKELCKKYPSVVCISTNVFYERGIFNKYAGMNEGLKIVEDDSWVLFLDSDIVLQPETKRVLKELNLDKNFIYGIDRLNIEGYDAYIEYKNGKGVAIENWLLTTAGLPLGSRLVHYYGHEGEHGRFEGWRPLGFFQLCHKSSFIEYPEDSKGADHCDLAFARLWPRSKRALIPELFALHLETKGARKALNWYGRKSGPFRESSPLSTEPVSSPTPTLAIIRPKTFSLWQKILRFFKEMWKAIVRLFRKEPMPY